MVVVILQPAFDVPVRDTVNVSTDVYVCVGSLSVEVELSPNLHNQETALTELLSKVIVNGILQPIVSGALKVTEGTVFTKMVLVVVMEQVGKVVITSIL